MKKLVFALGTFAFLSGCSSLGFLDANGPARVSRYDDDILAAPPTASAPPILTQDLPQSSEQKAILKQDIYLGMSAIGVKASWGEPHEVEFAGEANTDVQRWMYKMVLGSANGYYAENRVVYFENNRVIGWETK